MISRLFTPTLSYRLFDPMPLPRRAKISIGHSRVPKNRTDIGTPMFARKVRRIPTHS